jgi:preprotein translocase subunit SecA
MAFVTKILGKILGSKSDRDIKETAPFVELIKQEYKRLTNLTNDELRNETDKLRIIINERIQAEKLQIDELKKSVEEAEIQDSEKIYEQIDKLEEVVTEKLELVLNEILPVAFAIVKDTARRFFENETLEVTARQYDRDLASTRASISIKEDIAFWKNRWIAGGSEITSGIWFIMMFSS